MTTVALIDYKHPVEGYANRDQTGTFGSRMNANGLVGWGITKLKKNNLRLPNLALAYLKAIAKENGLSATHYSGMPNGEDLVIIATSMHQYRNEVELAHHIKAKYPSSRVGFTGAFSTTRPELFQNVADFNIHGEPELAFRRFCRGELDLKGRVSVGQEIDVTTLPFPDWDGIDLAECGYFPALLRKPFLTIQGSRGCPFACDFCPYIVMQKAPLRRRDNANIVAEVQYLIERYGIRSLLFRDITFSMHRPLTKELCRMIAVQKFDLDIGCETRLDTMDAELVDLMAEAGFRSINLGIESPEDDILLQSGRRPIAHQKMETLIERLEKNGIRVQGFYILGLVGDSEGSMRRTIDYSRMLNTFTAQYCLLTPFPGTKSEETLRDRIMTYDYSQYTEYDPVVRVEGVSPDKLVQIKNSAYNGYYLRPAWIRKHGLSFAKELVTSRFTRSRARTTCKGDAIKLDLHDT